MWAWTLFLAAPLLTDWLQAGEIIPLGSVSSPLKQQWRCRSPLEVAVVSANSKSMLQASYLFCVSIHLFTSVLQCGAVCSGAGLWGCLLRQDKASTWGQGSPSLGDLKQFHNIWVEGSASFGARAKEQEQLHFIPAIPPVSWLVCVQSDHSWESCVVPDVVPGCVRWLILQFYCVLKGYLYSNVPLALFLWRI